MTTQISTIIGPPGTGKTTELSRWSARAAERYGPDRVLVCSLTRTAARQAARDIDLPWSQIGTVHAFAHRALGSPDVAEGHLKEWNAAYPEAVQTLHNVSVDDIDLPHSDNTTGDVERLEVSRLRTLGVPESYWPNDLRLFHQRWEDWKKQNGYIDFGDMIAQALVECDTAPGDPQVILVDEAQDAGMAEVDLLMQWAKKAQHFVLAGDSQQAIFSFRGSDPLLLQRLWHEHDYSRQPLQQSYRLSRQVYAYAYEWAGRFEMTERIGFKPRDAEGAVERARFSFDTLTARGITHLLEQYPDKEVMFLATCGYMLDPVIRELREAGIPFHNPWRVSNGKWNPLPKGRAKGHTIVDRVLAFTRPDADIWGAQASFWSVPDIKAWVGGLPATGILARGGAQALQALSDHAPDTEIAAAFSRWFLPEVLLKIVPKPDVNWYLEQVKGSDVLKTFVKAVIREQGMAQLKERPRVSIGTIHSVKGGEADVVVLAPDISKESWIGAHKHPHAAEEIRRTIYVGITRTRDSLLLCQPSSRLAVRW